MLLELPGEMLPSVNFINIYPSDLEMLPGGEFPRCFSGEKVEVLEPDRHRLNLS